VEFTTDNDFNLRDIVLQILAQWLYSGVLYFQYGKRVCFHDTRQM